MTNIMYKASILMIATLASLACQPADEADDKANDDCPTYTTPSELWCFAATDAIDRKVCDCRGTCSPHAQAEQGYFCDEFEDIYSPIADCIPWYEGRACIDALEKFQCGQILEDIISPCEPLAKQ